MFKRKYIALLVVLAVFAACSPKTAPPQRKAFSLLNGVRDGYILARTVLDDQLADGAISAETWNTKIVPADNKLNTALHISYGALRVWNDLRDGPSLDALNSAITELLKAFALLKSISTPEAQPHLVRAESTLGVLKVEVNQ